jgi:hypothetical protein
MLEYLTGMLLTCAAFVAFGHDEQRRTVLVIAANWLLGWGYNEAFGTFTPWVWSTFIDTCAAFIILRHPAGNAQRLIGATYATQIALHGAYGVATLRNMHPDALLYWQWLTVIAWSQLAMVWIWGAYGGGKRWYSSVVRHPVAVVGGKDRGGKR